MDVELQILKHLARSPETTVSVIDQYCDSDQEIFGSDTRRMTFTRLLALISKGLSNNS